ncbi:MAG TPA: sigma-70 family RNA polymerase sigma factor [Bacteroidales bacterium]|nr:sigma-70 family RNA polymerase sigma factor [Bacteroidales bacterium]
MDEQYRWQQFLEGTQEALSEIFLTHHDDLFRYGLKLTGNQEMVKDCIQDLFLKLWKNRSNLKMVQSVKPYLFKSLRNHLTDSLEMQKPNLSLTDETIDYLNLKYSYEDFVVNDLVSKETRQQVITAINKLSSRQREAIYLRYFQDLDFETIAQIMEMNVQSVRNTLQRAMQFMRDLMLLHPFLIMLCKL